MISNFCILGERVSGTSFANALIIQNITGLKPTVEFGHKHFYQDMNKIRRSDTSKTLFVCVVREPVKWLQSMCKTTFHADTPIRNCQDMTKFLRMEWKCIYDETSGTSQNTKQYGSEMMMERDPDTKKRFENVMKMRTSKIKHWFQIKSCVEHFVVVNLEDLQKDPEVFTRSICEAYSLRHSSKFNPIKTVRGKGKVEYKPSLYPCLSSGDESYIISQLDLDVESELGYC